LELPLAAPHIHHEGTKDTKGTKKNNKRKNVVDSDACSGIGVLRVLRAFVVKQLGWVMTKLE
jgi:hypothetical protein